jgi:hypothetical protein
MAENLLHLILIAAGNPAMSSAACIPALAKWGLLAAWLTAMIAAMLETSRDWLRKR